MFFFVKCIVYANMVSMNRILTGIILIFITYTQTFAITTRVATKNEKVDP